MATGQRLCESSSLGTHTFPYTRIRIQLVPLPASAMRGFSAPRSSSRPFGPTCRVQLIPSNLRAMPVPVGYKYVKAPGS